MSKLYVLNRMTYSPAAGSLWSLVKGAARGIAGFVKGIAGSKTTTKLVETALPVAKKVAPYVAAAGLGASINALQSGGGESSGVSGGWGRRRRRGITATELRGYRKVANLIHKEGMVSKRARGRH